MRRPGLLLLVSLLPAAAAAQVVTRSAAPEGVAVTIYRDPNRGAGRPMELDWLGGYALITETRRIAIPAGEGEIRFEGVAGGILPESAIVTGLPSGVIEKNQDAWLLSPASLLDRSLGRRVHLRRTSEATGDVREQEAAILTGADGGVLLQTADGIEALRCTGLRETIVYDSVPQGLTSKPTLSVRTRSPHSAEATVTLSYLASGFDWQANYVATLAPSEDRLDLFAWVTLANGDETSFRDAATQTVAGRLNREGDFRRDPPRADPLHLRCWPAGTTSDIPLEEQGDGLYPPPPPPPPPAPMMSVSAENIVVTGSRVHRADQEDLGDLKLYRIPEPVTVASNSQKQVAMLEKEGVGVRSLYRQRIWPSSPPDLDRPLRVLVARNRAADGLGLPLPAGQIVLFASAHERPVLIGEGSVDDKAVGEEVEFEFGEAPGVISRAVQSADGKEWLVTVTNDRSRPIDFELVLEGDHRIATRARLVRRDGLRVWQTRVPANGSATLRYSVSVED